MNTLKLLFILALSILSAEATIRGVKQQNSEPNESDAEQRRSLQVKQRIGTGRQVGGQSVGSRGRRGGRGGLQPVPIRRANPFINGGPPIDIPSCPNPPAEDTNCSSNIDCSSLCCLADSCVCSEEGDRDAVCLFPRITP